MYTLKTQATKIDPETFLATVDNKQRCSECRTVMAMMGRITAEPPVMWGNSLIGFGSYSYSYASGHSGRWLLTGVSPRKANLTVYIMNGFSDYGNLLEQLGKHKLGKSCLYIPSLANIQLPLLQQLIRASVKDMKRIYPQ